jgi:hypothetical protein
MGEARDPDWYRAEAERLRRMAGETTDAVLRERYLNLAKAYDGLAGTLERNRHFPNPRD